VVDQPWRPLSLRKSPTRRRSRTIVLAVGVAALLAVGPLMLVMSQHPAPKPSAAEVTRNEAAAWVAQQVSDNDVVSCDVTMCLALKAHGVPVSNFLVMGPTARDLLNSQIIVSTAPIRRLFGRRLDTVYAPTVLASFGSGKAQIDVRVIAPHGAAAYLSALQSDLQQRKGVGAQLANVQQIRISAMARKQMISGQVSAQLLIVLTSLGGNTHSLDVLGFGDSGPGASQGVPLRSVYLAENGGTAAVHSMLAFLRAQPNIYRPAHAGTTQFDGHPALFIEFAAPVPLGLINGPN
jgi:hypothetical protein